MKTVKEVLKGHGREVWSVSPVTTAFEALEVMADKDIGALLVVESDRLVGIFSERDYARKVILMGRASKETPVSELMTPAVLYVTPKDTINECMALMTEKHVRHLPVLDNDRIAGIITIGDVVKEFISEQDIQIQSLEGYITARYQKTMGENKEITLRDGETIIEIPTHVIEKLIRDHLDRYNLLLDRTMIGKGGYTREELEELIVLWLEIKAHALNDSLAKLSSRATDVFFGVLEEGDWL